MKKRINAALTAMAILTTTAAEAEQGTYIAVPDGNVGGVYIVNTSDGSVRWCLTKFNGGPVQCTDVSE